MILKKDKKFYIRVNYEANFKKFLQANFLFFFNKKEVLKTYKNKSYKFLKEFIKIFKSRYGTLEQFTQGYEIDFSAQTCTQERYTIINDNEVSELIEQVYNKANRAVRQIKKNKKFELSRPEFIETIADTLKAGDKTAHEIATTLKLSSKYEQNFLKPILQQNLGLKWQTTQAKDKGGNTREFYTAL